MSLDIQVDPEAIKSLVEKARQVPNERMNDAISKLDDLQDTVSNWKGNGKSGHEEACAELKDALTNTQTLMTAILSTLDLSIEQFSEMDDEISAKFQVSVNHYLSE